MRCIFILAVAALIASCGENSDPIALATASATPEAGYPVNQKSEMTAPPKPMDEREAKIQIRRMNADDIAAATTGGADAKKLAWEAEFNNSAIYQEHNKIFSPLWGARENSRRAVACGLRTEVWRNVLLARMQDRLLSDQSVRMLIGSMTEGEKIAATASEKLLAKFLEVDKMPCDELEAMPFMKIYDIVAVGAGPL